ncbi:hypothetical protein L9F63_003636, partial [Diploptera punctata]
TTPPPLRRFARRVRQNTKRKKRECAETEQRPRALGHCLLHRELMVFSLSKRIWRYFDAIKVPLPRKAKLKDKCQDQPPRVNNSWRAQQGR